MKNFDLVLVVAGTYSEAQTWAKSKGLNGSQWVYAHSAASFVGLHFDKYAKVGGYTKNFIRLGCWFDVVLEPHAKDVTNDERIFTDPSSILDSGLRAR